ncbi:hypothetical protein GCM10028807_01520 [Spirosoma daeguense]
MTKNYGFLVVATLVSGLTYGQNNLVIRTPVTASPGAQNTLLGIGTGLSINSSGQDNTAVGYYAGASLTSAYDNTYVGYRAGYSNSTGPSNTFMGHESGYSNTFGSSNVFLGKQSGYYNTTGYSNVFIGSTAGYRNINGFNNVFIGLNTGTSNTSGNHNTFVGRGTGYGNTTGEYNTALGAYAAYNLSSGGNNVIVGYQAGNNTTTGGANVFAGYQAGFKNTTASANVFIGNQAGYNNTSGIGNLFLGQQAGANSNGSYNLFMGNGAGSASTTGEGNAAIGDGALYNSATGNSNTAIGRYAGINNLGSNNTFIGMAATNPVNLNLTNATAIGYNASVTASNAMILGNTSVNVGIGNSSPNNKLEITKGVSNQSGLRFTNLNNSSPATMLNQYKFLSVNEQGDVVMASVNSSAREGVAETLWQRKGSFLQSTQNEAVIIGNNVAHTPSGYKLFVEEGILTEKVKVAVKNTSDWSDYVFGDTYQLKELSEVERYVKANKHLPGLPSASEVVEKGIDVAKMDAKLLEKIEELTLYSIEQQKENQALKDKVAKLEKQHSEISLQQRKEIDEIKALVKQLLEKN